MPSSVFANNAQMRILFTDEQIFDIEEAFNWQIVRVYASTSQETCDKATRIQRYYHPASVIIWWGVAYDATTKLHFCEKGVNTSAKVYENTALEPVVKPLNNTLFSNEHRSFRQDLAPARKTNSTKVWLRGIFRSSLLRVFPGNWPFSSSDLNPMDSKSGQCLKASSVRRVTPILKA